MIRENWRIIVLVILLLTSAIALFVPGIGLGSSPDSAINLQYGLDLSGGTSVSAPLVGLTATDVDVGDRNQTAVEDAVAAGLPDVEAVDVVYRPRVQSSAPPAIEVRANVTEEAFASALDAASVTYDDIQHGVTSETRDRAIRVIRDKIDKSGLGDQTVQSVFSPADDRWYLKIEIPGTGNVSEAVNLIEAEGQVRIYAYHSVVRNGSTEWTNTTALTQDGFRRVSLAEQGGQGQGPHVPVTIKESEASDFQQLMVDSGIATRTGSSCGWPGSDQYGGDRGPCLLVVSDGSVIGSYGMAGDLGGSMVQGTWSQDPRFILETGNFSEARQLSIVLRAGALPTEIAIADGTVYQISASRAGDTKFQALLTGIVAVLAVAGVVSIRYRDFLVAAPMVVTALSEVVILLGFAALVGLALDLSHLAGFIAVIGTGVDDLIIIANEVRSEGRISGGRVFENRFKKAFWVIGAAAITTIIAMSPLAILSLGDLRGFAIVTILGVIIGVLITRPAYGDILRALVADR